MIQVIYTMAETQKIVKLSETSIWKMRREKKFPEPDLKIGAKKWAYTEDTLNKWIESQRIRSA